MQSDYIQPNDEEDQEKLEQDFDTPFAPPSDAKRHLSDDDPSKDVERDPTEWYQEGDDAGNDFPDQPHRSKPPQGFTIE